MEARRTPDTVRLLDSGLMRRRLTSACRERQGIGIAEPKIVVWAHNSHLGDARFTDMGRKRGEVNVGQLMRERYVEPDVCLPWLKTLALLPM